MTTSRTKVLDLALHANDVKTSVKSFQLSKKYVKRLIPISVINIIYHRIDIPQSEFESKNYEKVPYVLHKRKSQNKFIKAYHVIGGGIMDAFEKDFLKQISLYILQKQTRKPLEMYNIKIYYNKEADTSDQKPGQVKNATMDFIKALAQLPGKKWKEENVELFVELFYNEGTPREYEPPNYEASHESLNCGRRELMKLGRINTGFHKLSAWGTGKNFSESLCSTPGPSILIEDEDVQEHVLEDESKRNPKRPRIETNEVDCENVSLVSSEYETCMCKWRLPEEYETAKCTKCYGTVHLACHGYISSKAFDRNSFICFVCAGSKDNKDLNMKMKLRIILYGIRINKCVPYELELAFKDEKKYILEQLDEMGVISLNSASKDINLKNLDMAIKLLFKSENSQFFEANFSLE